MAIVSGNSPVMKRLVQKQGTAEQIITPNDLFTFCIENIPSIKILFAEKNKVD